MTNAAELYMHKVLTPFFPVRSLAELFRFLSFPCFSLSRFAFAVALRAFALAASSPRRLVAFLDFSFASFSFNFALFARSASAFFLAAAVFEFFSCSVWALDALSWAAFWPCSWEALVCAMAFVFVLAILFWIVGEAFDSSAQRCTHVPVGWSGDTSVYSWLA